MENYIDLFKVDEGSSESLLERLGNRQKMLMPEVVSSVEEILAKVRLEGDAAVLAYTAKFDRAKLDASGLEVHSAELEAAKASLEPELFEALREAADNIRLFHEKQLEQEQDMYIEAPGKKLSLLRRPLARVGLYVPGGTGGSTPLPSSVLMNAIPAKAAGVEELIMCTPPASGGLVNSSILVAAKLAGVARILKVGGAQAIAAMSYGTESVPAVDKICGPGNIYVNTAKRMVFGQVDIDMFAGPSEILIVADKGANSKFVARDLLSQAEHDALASAILLTEDEGLAAAVQKEISVLVEQAPRKEILMASLRNYGAIVVLDKMHRAIEIINDMAPEHLELCLSDEWIEQLLPKIKNAGAIFLGYYSPEPLGDYWAGPNHVLPTSGSARFFSPLNTGDFIKKMSVIRYEEEALKADGKKIIRLAQAEGLDCHAAAIAIRLGEEDLA